MSNYTPAEAQLYERAMLTIPGMVGCMVRQSEGDGRILLAGYMREGRELKISPEQCWAIIFTASLHWVGQLTTEIAESSDLTREEIAQGMATMVATWQNDGALRGH